MAKQKHTKRPEKIIQIKDNTPAATELSKGPKWLIWLILLICFGVFSPSLKNDFVNWDDDRNVYENPLIVNQKEIQHKKIFSTPVIGNYNPLSNWTFAVEYHFFGMNPKVMHWTNLILHLICVFFSFKILQNLGLKPWFAAFGALLFAIHPMRVESVAWITERKDVLFAAFFLPAFYLYLQKLDRPKSISMVWIFLLFAIGLFAKIQMVSLPLAMLTADYLKGRPLKWNLITEKWIFLFGSLAFGLLGLYILRQEGSLEANQTHAGILRIFIGCYSFLTYLIKWLIPYMNVPLYPYPEKLTIWHYLSLPGALVVAFGYYLAFRKKMTQLFFGLTFFLVNVFFLLQFLGAGQGYLADRFTYVAYLGLFFVMSWYMQKWWEQFPHLRSFLRAGIAFYLSIFAILSYRQCKFWKNSDTLWTRVIEYYDNTPLPFNNRANYYRDLKQFDKALADYSKAISLNAGHATFNSRAKLFFNRNEDQKAIEDYNIAIQKSPGTAEYYTNRGAAYAKLNQLDQALVDLNKAVELDKDWKVAYLNRSIIFQIKGDFANALADIDNYLRLEPNNADLWYEGARCQRMLNNLPKAIEYFTTSIQYNPKLGLAYLERAKTYESMGQVEKAQNDYLEAGRLGVKQN
ncbi:MAG: tetratricopeptide repeat protein [Saprospiraceae bacterium]|nr:tetratricopeptide repeat protein [Saprospiraceae bacterium]